MILLKRLELTNFLSHKNTVLDLMPDSQILIDGASGSGKSSIVEAIVWCLYGRGRSDNRNMIRHGAKSALVFLELLDKNSKVVYRIGREVSDTGKQKLEIETWDSAKKDWLLMKTIGFKDSQRWLEEELIHCSYTLFINSVAYPQENTENFVKQTAVRRKEMLLESVNAADFDLYYNRAKDKLQLTLEKTSRLGEKVYDLQHAIEDNMAKAGMVEELNLSITDFKGKRETAAGELGKFNERRIELKTKQAELDFLKANLSDETKRLNESAKHIGSIKDKMKEIDLTDPIKSDPKKIEGLEAEIMILEENIKYDYDRQLKLNALMANKPSQVDYNQETTRLNKALAEAEGKVDLWCPEIKRVCNRLKFELEDRLKDTRNRLVELEDAESKQNKAINDYQVDILALGPQKGSKEAFARLRNARGELSSLKASGNINDGYRKLYDTLLEQLFKEEDNLAKYAESAKELEKKCTTLIGTMTVIADEKLDSKCLVLESTLKTFNNQIDSYSAQLVLAEEAQRWNKAAQTNIDGFKEELHQEGEVAFSLSLVKDAFGSKGLKTLVVEMLIPRLESKINNILSSISNFSVRLETQRSSADGEGAVEGFYINVINGEGNEFSFDNYSGGEKNRINYAIFEGLASLQRCGFRIYDESVSNLNDEVVEEFADTLLNLNTERQVLAISHIDVVKNRFANKMTVTKRAGVSELK